MDKGNVKLVSIKEWYFLKEKLFLLDSNRYFCRIIKTLINKKQITKS